MRRTSLAIYILLASLYPVLAQSQTNYCPSSTIVFGTPDIGQSQSATVSSSQWDQNADNLTAICRGETTPRGTSLPASCTVGQLFFDTDATAGSNIYGCTSADTWTLQSGGGGGGSQNVFSTIDAPAGTDPVADAPTDTLILNTSSPITITGDAATDTVTWALTQNAGTDVTADLEEETHASEHHENASDEVSADALASSCASGAPLEGDGAGGLQCGTDDVGTDDQTAAEVAITDAGGLYAATDVEGALQETPPGARVPTAHATAHAEDGSDELLGEALGTTCTDGQILVANPTGGFACGNPGSASFTTLSGDYGDETVTSTWDLSSALIELPNSTSPVSTDCDDAAEAGRIHVDTDAPSGQQLYLCEGASGWVLSSGAASGGALYLRDEKASGTNGGDATAAAWNTRTLNVEVADTIGSTLSSNQWTLPAGTYRVSARAPAGRCGSHQLRLRNITSGSTSLVGAIVASSGSSSGDWTTATLQGTITIGSTTTFELQHFIQLTSVVTDSDLGLGFNTGEIGIFAEVWVDEE